MRRIPRVPLALGLAGLIPFWALPLACFFPPSGLSAPATGRALATYAAIILSFLGGIRWGLASKADRTDFDFFLSVLPSLAAWALLLAREPWRLLGLGVLALALGPIDARMTARGLAPEWLGSLRLVLSTAAGAALLLGALALWRHEGG